jgi:N-acetylneuraminate lyase
MKSIEGLIAAVYPPLDKNGKLHLDAIGPYAQFLSDNQLNGVFINGSTGDFASLSLDERKLIVEEWSRCKPAGFTLMVHVGDTNIDHCVELAEHANHLKIDAISSLAPYYYRPATNKELIAICKKIAESSPEIPFYYYHIPLLTHVNFDMVEFMELASGEIPNFSGIKYSHENLVEFKYCMEFAQGKYDLLFGVDEILICVLSLGATGAIGSTYNQLAPLFHKLIKSFKNGEMQQAAKLQFEVMKFVKILSSYGFHAASKATLKILGVDLGPVRLPLRNLTSEETAQLERELAKSGILELVYPARFPS